MVINSLHYDSPVDTVKLNDITQNVEQNWNSLQSLDEQDFGASFVVVNNSNMAVYRNISDKDSAENKEAAQNVKSYEDAIKKRYPYQNISVGGDIVGSVIMIDSSNAFNKAHIRRVLYALTIAAIILLLGTIGFGLYVKKSIIDPFDRMQEFAGKVALGNLDEPLMMEKNNMFGAFTESFDIMREELASSQKREAELQRKEKELVASLSHDLKTPITGIKLTSELLKAKFEMNSKKANNETSENKNNMSPNISEKDMMEKLDNIYKKADQIDVLVSDLFSSTLDDLGEFKVNCDDTESTVLSDILKKHDDRGLVSEGDVPKVIINIDTKRMNQVIGNILVNSYKYADTKIDVNYRLVDDYLEMKIRDYGPGVSRDELDLITNKFYRGKVTEDNKKEGSGLGLYISKNLMEKMNGDLICDSEGEGKGLEVTLLIPLS